jgi:hypothetical protein
LLYKPAANLSINSFSDAESLIGLEVALIDGPLLATVPLLVLILSPGVVKSRMLLLVLVLKLLNIELWLILLPRCYRFAGLLSPL